MRRGLVILAALAFAACDDGGGTSDGGEGGGGGGQPTYATVSGHALAFTGGPVPGGTVRIVQDPSRTTTTAADGAFSFEDLEVGSEVTFELAHDDYVPIQTSTLVVPDGGAERFTFQAVRPDTYALLSAVVDIEPDPTRCQIATTVTRIGKSIYDEGAHGEAGATVTIEPPLPAEQGPIYFNASVIPDRALTETSDDGGVLFVQVPPGRYVLRAHKPDTTFTEVTIDCEAGILMNASPPWGLQKL